MEENCPDNLVNSYEINLNGENIVINSNDFIKDKKGNIYEVKNIMTNLYNPWSFEKTAMVVCEDCKIGRFAVHIDDIVEVIKNT